MGKNTKSEGNGFAGWMQSHERESDAGVAGGRFHDHAAGLQFAAAFGRVDDAFGDAVLGRAARVQVFDLHRDGGFDAVGHVVEFDERGVADEFGQGIVDGHDVSFARCGSWAFRMVLVSCSRSSRPSRAVVETGPVAMLPCSFACVACANLG